MRIAKTENNTMTSLLVGTVYDRDEHWITIVKYVWTQENRKDAVAYRLTAEGEWVRYEQFEMLQPTMRVSGFTRAYGDDEFKRWMDTLVGESRERDDAHSARIVDTLRKVLA